MKILFILALVFATGNASAQCFNSADPASVRYCETDPGMGQYGPNSCPDPVLKWTDLTGILKPTEDTLETCTGYWLPTAQDVQLQSGVADPQTMVAAVQNVEIALNEGVLAIVLALACVCFFVGLNSWEPAAK